MSSTIAPTKLITADELWEMPDDGFRYELVKGELRQMTPAGSEHGAMIMNLGAPLKVHVKTHNLGVVFGAETGFQLTNSPDSVRAPDIAFVRRERIPATGIPRGYWKGAPDLAVEVVSPNDKLYEIDEKVDDHLAAGAQVVWVVYPKRRSVTIYRAEQREPQVLTMSDTLDGGEVVTGFKCRVSEVFE